MGTATMGNQQANTQRDTDTFTPEKSRISEERLDRWRNEEISGDLEQIPGIGPSTVSALQEQGIITSFQLIGHFLRLIDADGVLPACDKFKQFLGDCGTPKSYRDTIVLAVG